MKLGLTQTCDWRSRATRGDPRGDETEKDDFLGDETDKDETLGEVKDADE